MDCLCDVKVCARCHKRMKPFSKTADWKGRKYHMSCYHMIRVEFAAEELMHQMRETYKNEERTKAQLVSDWGKPNVTGEPPK